MADQTILQRAPYLCVALMTSVMFSYYFLQDDGDPIIWAPMKHDVYRRNELFFKKTEVPRLRGHGPFGGLPETFSSKYRNPCWKENSTLRCLPYFYQIGSYKCGTTDLWGRLVQHPDVIPVAKEIHWWAWRRFGYTDLPIHGPLVLKIRNETGMKDDSSLQWYFNYVSDQATHQIEGNPKLVFGDASISNLWGLAEKARRSASHTGANLTYLADLIHTLQPDAKITAIVRDPVDKLWSTYWYQPRLRRKASFENVFDQKLRESATCLRNATEKYCAFVYRRGSPAAVLSNVIDQGKYVLYLEEWIRAFGLENVHIIRLEDWQNNTSEVLDGLVRYLGLDPLPRDILSEVVAQPRKNANKRAPPNLTVTLEMREKLQNYYRPWNIRLAKLLNDSRYRWGY